MTPEKIAVIGIGRMGLCTALNLEQAGYDVLGIDRDGSYICALNAGSFRTSEPGVGAALAGARNFRASEGIDSLRDFPAGLVVIAVDTPSSPGGGYDHRHVDAVFRSLRELNHSLPRVDVVVKCTTMPGYCDSVAGEALAGGYVVSYSPEFIAQGTILRDQQYPDQVLIGEGDRAGGDLLESVYRRVCRNRPVILRTSRMSAELAKIGTNCYLTMKIAFANAIGDLASRAGADAAQVLSAIGADSRIGEKFLRYGFGYGGPCLPRDNRALRSFAREHGDDFLLSQAADETNRRHADFQYESATREVGPDGTHHFHGVTYKAGSDILEESQSLSLALRLAQAGRRVTIHEKQSTIERLRELYGDMFEYRSDC